MMKIWNGDINTVNNDPHGVFVFTDASEHSRYQAITLGYRPQSLKPHTTKTYHLCFNKQLLDHFIAYTHLYPDKNFYIDIPYNTASETFYSDLLLYASDNVYYPDDIQFLQRYLQYYPMYKNITVIDHDHTLSPYYYHPVELNNIKYTNIIIAVAHQYSLFHNEPRVSQKIFEQPLHVAIEYLSATVTHHNIDDIIMLFSMGYQYLANNNTDIAQQLMSIGHGVIAVDKNPIFGSYDTNNTRMYFIQNGHNVIGKSIEHAHQKLLLDFKKITVPIDIITSSL